MDKNRTPLLNEEDFEKLKQRGLSEEEIENLKISMGLVDASNMIPDDITELLEKIDNYFPNDDAGKTLEMFFELAEKDPDFFMQIVALQTLIGVVDTPIAETHVSDALRQIREAENEEERTALINDLLGRIKGLNTASKAEFLKEMHSLNTEDKKELLEILNNN